MERAAPQELSQKRSRRQIIIRYTLEVFQELKQPVSLSIFLAILRNLLQQRLCLRLNHSQLIKHRRIEHRIGILLEREYPLVLTRPYRRPAMNGFLGRDTSILVIADDAAKQTVVCRRDIIVIVQKNRGQRRSIYSEYLLLRDVGRQLRFNA